jgi:hypothetical protein
VPCDRLDASGSLKRRSLLSKGFNTASGGECPLWVRRCISSPVVTSIYASCVSGIAVWAARRPMKRLIPIGQTVSANNGSCVFGMRHRSLPCSYTIIEIATQLKVEEIVKNWLIRPDGCIELARLRQAISLQFSLHCASSVCRGGAGFACEVANRLTATRRFAFAGARRHRLIWGYPFSATDCSHMLSINEQSSQHLAVG